MNKEEEEEEEVVGETENGEERRGDLDQHQHSRGSMLKRELMDPRTTQLKVNITKENLSGARENIEKKVLFRSVAKSTGTQSKILLVGKRAGPQHCMQSAN